MLSQFIASNTLPVQEKWTRSVPVYYFSLRDAYHHYFQTYKRNENVYHLLSDIGNYPNIEGDFNDVDLTSFTVLGFQRFFELFYKEMMASVHPFLPVRFERDFDIIKLINNNLLVPADYRPVEFVDGLRRFKELCSDFAERGITNPIVDKFRFLATKESLEVLTELARLRNKIAHDGNILPNMYALDILVAKGLSPIVLQIIDAQQDRLQGANPVYCSTITGIEIIREMATLRLDHHDFKNKSKHEELKQAILKLAHLKELARATSTLSNAITRNNKYHQPYFKNAVARYQQFARHQQKHEDFLLRALCPACGFNTLVVYKTKGEPPAQRPFSQWLTCYTCSYSISDQIGDPFEFNLSGRQYFRPDA